jgi:hypothetical protein
MDRKFLQIIMIIGIMIIDFNDANADTSAHCPSGMNQYFMPSQSFPNEKACNTARENTIQQNNWKSDAIICHPTKYYLCGW